MRQRLRTLLFSLMLALGGPLQAAEWPYYGPYNDSPARNMMASMWDFMDWFLGRRYGDWGGRGWDPYGPYAPPYSGWDDPFTPWQEVPPLDGTWQAQSGEIWYLRGHNFVLLDNGGARTPGEFYLVGEFMRVRMPWGERELAYRQFNGLLVLSDVNGNQTVLHRVGAAGWNW